MRLPTFLFKTHMKKTIATIGLLLVLLLFGFALLTSTSTGRRTSVVKDAEAQIQKNQAYFTENLEQYNAASKFLLEWDARKKSNKLNAQLLEDNGYNFDWDQNIAVEKTPLELRLSEVMRDHTIQ